MINEMYGWKGWLGSHFFDANRIKKIFPQLHTSQLSIPATCRSATDRSHCNAAGEEATVAGDARERETRREHENQRGAGEIKGLLHKHEAWVQAPVPIKAMNDDVYSVAETNRSLKNTGSQPSQISELHIQWDPVSRNKIESDRAGHLTPSFGLHTGTGKHGHHTHSYPHIAHTCADTHTVHTQTKNREERQEYFASHSKTKTVTDSLNRSQKVFKQVEKVLDLKANNSPLTTPTPLTLGSSGSNPKI